MRFPRLLLILTILLLVKVGWAAAPTPGTESYWYFVSTTGTQTHTNGVENPLTYANNQCFSSLVEALTYINAHRSTSDTKCVYVLPGTYTTAFSPSTSNECNLTLTGCLGVTPKDSNESARELVIISPTGTAIGSTSNAHDINVRNLSIGVTSNYGVQFNTDNCGLQHCYIYPSAGSTVYPIWFASSLSGLQISRCLITAPSNKVSINMASSIAVSGQIDNNIFTQALNTSFSGGINSTTTGTLNIYNNVIIGYGDGIAHSGSGTLNIINNIIQGYGYAINGTAGVLNATNNFLIGPPTYPTRLVTGLTIDSNNIKVSDTTNDVGNPMTASFACNKGIIIPCIDDSGNLHIVYDGTSNDWSTALGNRGLHGTFFMVGVDALSYGNTLANIRAMIQAGNVELGSHSWSHNSPTASSWGTITYSGSGTSPQYAIDLTGHTISVSVTGAPSDNYTYNLASDNSDSMATVISDIRSHTSNHWNVSASSNMNTNIKVSSFESVGNTDITTPISLDLTGYTQGYYKNEIVDNKAYLADTLVNGDGNIIDPQTDLTYVCNSMACPYDLQNSGYKTAQYNSGLLGARMNTSGHTLYNYDLYSANGGSVTVGTLTGSTTTETKNLTRAVCWASAQAGQPIFILGHNDTVAEWIPILDALQEMQSAGVIQVMSAQQAFSYIRNPSYYNPVTGVSSWVISAVNDYRLLASSPLIGAGTSTGVVPFFDYWGKLWKTTPSIGVDEPNGFRSVPVGGM